MPIKRDTPRPRILQKLLGLASALSISLACANKYPSAAIEEADAAYGSGRYEQALKIFSPAADKGVALAQHRMGEMYHLGRGMPVDLSKAVIWYEKAAAQGNLEAQNNLGSIYYGLHDYSRALKYFLKAAQAGKTEAQFNMGNMYFNGEGATRDYVKAARWYAKAAANDDPRAQNNLGYMHENGLGLPKDEALSFSWYKKAAERGSRESQARLGAYYESERGGHLDRAEAYKWYLLSSAQGLEGAKQSLKSLESRMTPEQISEAKFRAGPVRRDATPPPPKKASVP